MNTENTAAPVVEKAPKIEQNGVTRPNAGTSTGSIWEIADAMSVAAGAPAKRGEVLKAAEAEGINVSTAATQFGRWTKFHGIVAAPKVKAEKAPKEPKAPKEKKAKAPKAEVAPAAVVAAE